MDDGAELFSIFMARRHIQDVGCSQMRMEEDYDEGQRDSVEKGLSISPGTNGHSTTSVYDMLGEEGLSISPEDRSMDTGLPPVQDLEARDWSLLPLDVLASVFNRLSIVDVLMGAGLVCRSWLQAVKLPDVWRVVRVHNGLFRYVDGIDAMLKAAVDRSDGQLRVLDLDGERFLKDEVMQYILERSPSLTSISLLSCMNVFSKRLLSAIRKSPLLKLNYIKFEDSNITMEQLTSVLENCPALTVLQVVNCIYIYEDDVHELRAKFPRIKTIKIEHEDSDYSGLPF
uniref:Uncharacterized protein n=1 Tax=Avena sativa TaxID=4498 RepID=A0ACD5XAA1_AVESA